MDYPMAYEYVYADGISFAMEFVLTSSGKIFKTNNMNSLSKNNWFYLALLFIWKWRWVKYYQMIEKNEEKQLRKWKAEM